MERTGKKPGRPKGGESVGESGRLTMRLTDDERAYLLLAAESRNLSLTAFIRESGLKEARRILNGRKK